MKRTYNHITTLAGLQRERLMLKNSYESQGEVLKENVGIYVRQFSPIYLFKKFFNKESFDKLDGKVNISGKIMSLILPLFLNKTLFKGSGFLTKTVVGLVSNKLGAKLDVEHLAGIFDSVKGFFAKKKDKQDKRIDYGIPPDSETY